jgi:hypothetical protein
VRAADAPCFGIAVLIVWLKRVWRCGEADCPQLTWSEEHELVAPRAVLTSRVAWATDALSRVSARSASTSTPGDQAPTELGGTPARCVGLATGDRRDCKLHDLDNVYVADSSFFVFATAVNPTLTIIANALRVADTITHRLGRTTFQAQPANQGLPVITEMAGDRAGTASR